jgi:hypothetical protein
MRGTADSADFDALVARVLAAFDLAQCERDARWRAQLRDLRRILAAGYREAVGDLYRRGALPVRSFIRDVGRDFPSFNVEPIKFDAGVQGIVTGLGIKLRLQGYTRRMALRGFYHREPGFGSVIWVNAAHHPGAVTASLAHEMGHWYRERLLGRSAERTSIAFLNANFASHLTRPDELFADLFVVFGAYPTAVAEQLFPRGGWRGAVRRVTQLDRPTLTRLRQYLSVNYGFDAHQRDAHDVPRRIYYVTSMLHFARLRWALLQEIGV